MENIQINNINRINPKDKSRIVSKTLNRKFGKANDYIEFHVFDMGGSLLYSIENYEDWQYPDEQEGTLTNTLFVDPTKKLQEIGFTQGQYSCVFNLQRKKIFDTFTKLFYIYEISPSRTELKIKSEAYEESEVQKMVGRYMSEIGNAQFEKDFILNFGDNKNILGINIAYDTANECTLIKLYEPLPENINEKSNLRICEDVIDPIEFVIDLGTATPDDPNIAIKGPNFRIDTRLLYRMLY